jgi:UDP-N-acetylglucosamine acyltransferase
MIRRYTTLGERNVVHPFVVLGGEPQDYGHDPSVRSTLRIGGGNVFREHVTINRATGEDKATVVGDNNYFMAYSHAGHNAEIGSNCILVNGAAMGGYAVLEDRAILSAHVVVHQFCRVGTMVMTQGNSATSAHLPPYCMLADVNKVVGLNKIGLRRSDALDAEDRRQITEAYGLLYRSGLPTSKALAEMDAHSEWGAAADRFRQFVRFSLTADPPYNRGLCVARTMRKG